MDWYIHLLLLLGCCIKYTGGCSDQFDSTTAVQVCQAGSISGQQVAIIAYGGAPVGTTCTCNVRIRGGTRNYIQYYSPGYKDCGLRFAVGNVIFSCSDAVIEINTSFQVKFEKTVNSEGPDACFAIRMDTTESSMAIIECASAGSPLPTLKPDPTTRGATTTTRTRGTSTIPSTTPPDTTHNITTQSAPSTGNPETSRNALTSTAFTMETTMSATVTSSVASTAHSTTKQTQPSIATTSVTTTPTTPSITTTQTQPTTTSPDTETSAASTPTSTTTQPTDASTASTVIVTTTEPSQPISSTGTSQPTTTYSTTHSDVTAQPVQAEDKEYTVVIIVSVLGGGGVLIFALAILIICRKQWQSKDGATARRLDGGPINGYAGGNAVVVGDTDLWDTSPRYSSPRGSTSPIHKPHILTYRSDTPGDIYSIVMPGHNGRIESKYPSYYLNGFPAHEAASHMQSLTSYIDQVPMTTRNINTNSDQHQTYMYHESIDNNMYSTSRAPATNPELNTSLQNDIPDSYRQNNDTLMKMADVPPLEL